MRGISVLALGSLVSCGGDDCPPGTRKDGDRCVSVGDADSDTDCADAPFYRDADGDGFGDEGDVVCAVTDGYVEAGGDCDDSDPDVKPGVTDVCNGIDDDCANGPDTGAPCVAGTDSPCSDTPCGSEGTSTCSDACEPGICVPPAETCNGVDDDCDGDVDQGLYLLGDPVQVSADPGDDHAPDVAWMGAAFFVVWSNAVVPQPIRYARIVDGAPEPAGDQTLPPDPTSSLFHPRVSRLGDDFVLAFTGASGGPGIAGIVLGCEIDPLAPSATGCVLWNEFADEPWSSTPYSSGLAASHDVAAVGFVNDVTRGEPFDVTVGLFDATPEAVGSVAIVGTTTRTGSTSVAWNEEDGAFLVAWATGTKINVARVDEGGTEIGEDAPVVNPVELEGLYGQDVAWGAGRGLVAYVRDGVERNVEVQAIDSSAQAVNAPIVIGPATAGPAADRPLDLVWIDGAWLLTWVDGATGGVVVAHLNPDGRPTDAPAPLSPEGALVMTSAVAWSGEVGGVAWVDDSAGDLDIWFAEYGCE